MMEKLNTKDHPENIGTGRLTTNFGVKIGKLVLSNPIVCASGTFGFGEELRGIVDFKNMGAVITKTITLFPRAGNSPPRIFETECGVLNSIGLENPGVEAFIRDKAPNLDKINTKIIVSIGGGSVGEYSEIVNKLENLKNIEAFELNLSCPNIKDKKIVSQNEKMTYKLIKAVRSATKRTLIAKITPEVTDITRVAAAAEDAGADAVSLVNTFFAMAIDIEKKKPYLCNGYGGYSGRAIKPLSLYRVWRCARKIKIPIIGGGGIETASDAIEFILAGATAVSLGTINLVYPNAARTVLDGIKQYLRRSKTRDINDLKGKLKV